MKAIGQVFLTVLLATTVGQGQYLSVQGSVPLSARADVAVSGTNAFAVGTNSLSIVSFSNPQSPSVLGQVSPGVGSLKAVAVSGNYAYCAGQASGIVVIDISNPNSPMWVRNVQAAAPIEHVAVGDTFLAAATGLNVTFFGLSNPAQPRFLTTYGRAANRVVVDAAARRVHCAGPTGAFVLSWTVSQGSVTLSSFDEFGSGNYTHVSLGGSYANFVQGLQFSALNKNTYSLAGQYGAAGQINALNSGSDYSVIGLSTGGVEYLRQTSGTPQFVSSVQTTGGVNGVAATANGQFVLAATTSGLTVIANSPLSSDPDLLLPQEFSLSAYPNPFNGSTTITWTGRFHQAVELSIVDVLGREVMRETIAMDRPSAQLNFSGLSAGSYYVLLSSSEHSSGPLRIVYLP